MSTKKLDEIRALEAGIQQEWEAAKVFEVDAPADGEAKADETFFVTFPYPYMNGPLHLGHTFTISKAEFAVGYQRLKGKVTLYPMGFHCTGMPIKASADKIIREIEVYGNPPAFPPPEEEADAEKVKQHAKVAAKSGDFRFQWQILENGCGISPAEIPNFTDPQHWLNYFPPLAIDALKQFGLSTDWRRSFITTPANPYYDMFVRWQMTLLKEMDFIRFGKRYTIYSPKDGQPCMDHERAKGEGVGPQEYTGIKMQVVEPLPEKLSAFAGKSVFLVAATLRPETMYGQTNCWLHPTIRYVAWEAINGEIFVSTERAARNMAFQDLTPESGKYKIVAELTGQDIMGIKLKAPFAKYDVIYTLPMLTIKENKGTGVVTSVPSDSPDDFASIRNLKEKPLFREKYGITDEMVLPFEPVPIIRVPEYGDLCAIVACEKYGIKSPNDKSKLEEAKEDVYKKGFYQGTMIIGDFSGQPTSEAKDKITQQLVDAKMAFKYMEPEKEVVSRSNDQCIVALCDQWFLTYGEKGWRATTDKVLKQMETYNELTNDMFERTLDWLHEHACSRTYGLGTKLPWDENWLVESLSDSTIYMSYYTIAHMLQGGTLDGSNGSPLGIKPEECTREFFDAVFLGKEPSAACAVSKDNLAKLRNEFLYWYPMDMRVSGKDLIGNHLTYCMYNHAAIFPEKHWPRSIRANGHLMLNNKKMSKSTGNFLTLVQAIAKYGSDATRLCLADAGDDVTDANFEEDAANKILLRVYKEKEWVEETLKGLRSLRCGPMDNMADKMFLAEMAQLMNTADDAYSRMMFREAVQASFFEFLGARDRYRKRCAEVGMHRDLIVHYITMHYLINSPFAPHMAEHVWKMLGNRESVLKARWPARQEPNTLHLQMSAYLDKTETKVRQALDKQKKAVTKATIYVAKVYPEWQAYILNYLTEKFDANDGKLPDNKTISADLKGAEPLKKHMKLFMKFASMVKGQAETQGRSALALTVPFDELQLLHSQEQYLCRQLGITVEVLDVATCDNDKVTNTCKPGTPVTTFS